MSAGRAASAGLTLRRSYPAWWIAALVLGAVWIAFDDRAWRTAVHPARAAGAWRASIALPWLAFGGGVLLARFLAQLERLRQVERAGLGTGLGGPADAFRGSMLGGALAGALFTGALSFGLHQLSADAPATHRALAAPPHDALLARNGAELAIAPPSRATHLSVPLRRVPGRPTPEAVQLVLLDAAGGRLARAPWQPGTEVLIPLQNPDATAGGSWRLRVESDQPASDRAPALYLPADGLRWLHVEGSSVHAALQMWLWATAGWLGWCALGAWLSAGLGSAWVLLLAGAALGAAWFSDAVAPWIPLGDSAERIALWRSGWSASLRAGFAELAGFLLWLAALGPGAARLAEPRPGAREVDA